MRNISKIRNGSLYFNEETRKVERVLGAVNSQRVWTKRHQSKPQDVQTKNLRLANDKEVNSYTKESKLGNLPPMPEPQAKEFADWQKL